MSIHQKSGHIITTFIKGGDVFNNFDVYEESSFDYGFSEFEMIIRSMTNSNSTCDKFRIGCYNGSARLSFCGLNGKSTITRQLCDRHMYEFFDATFSFKQLCDVMSRSTNPNLKIGHNKITFILKKDKSLILKFSSIAEDGIDPIEPVVMRLRPIDEDFHTCAWKF